jgi:hypothetical protein
MMTIVQHESIQIELEMDKPATYLKDKGYLHPIKILSKQPDIDLTKLTSLTLWGRKVIGVWIPDVDKGEQVGLLLEEKVW